MQLVIKQQQEEEIVCYHWSSDCVYGSSKNIKNSFVSMSDASLVCNYYQSYLLLLHTLQLSQPVPVGNFNMWWMCVWICSPPHASNAASLVNLNKLHLSGNQGIACYWITCAMMRVKIYKKTQRVKLYQRMPSRLKFKSYRFKSVSRNYLKIQFPLKSAHQTYHLITN